MSREKTLSKFLSELDSLLIENREFVDDEGNETIDESVTEDIVYTWIMNSDEEYHFLGTNKVKQLIHIFFTDYKSRMILLNAFNCL